MRTSTTIPADKRMDANDTYLVAAVTTTKIMKHHKPILQSNAIIAAAVVAIPFPPLNFKNTG